MGFLPGKKSVTILGNWLWTWGVAGLARVLVDKAIARVRELGLAAVQLQVRVELVENRAAFEQMGFQVVRGEAHPGYDRVTSWVMKRVV